MHAKRDPAGRIRELRAGLDGEHGSQVLAWLWGLPQRSWASFDRVITMPGEVRLAYVLATEADLWLLRYHECR